jgi:hypothetical protein
MTARLSITECSDPQRTSESDITKENGRPKTLDVIGMYERHDLINFKNLHAIKRNGKNYTTFLMHPRPQKK